MTLARLLVSSLIAVAIVACGRDEASQPLPEDPIQSVVEAVPLPPEATERLFHEAGGYFYTAYHVPDVDLDVLEDWYAAWLPEGDDFAGWAWCETARRQEELHRIYQKVEEGVMLGITLQDESTPPHRRSIQEVPAVVVSTGPGTLQGCSETPRPWHEE